MTAPGGLRSIDSAFWRRFARWGAQGPEWIVRTIPAVVGLIVWAVAAERRRAIGRSLRRVRGERGAVRDAIDVASTFVTFAYCLTDVLSAGSKSRGSAHALVRGELHMEDALK
ncbi:MAG: lysophospholipid acyltransferase family protein, partial [Polyangiaceae bacterium]